MTLKKKVLVGTLATTMAVTAFAGLPLSSKGLAEKLGVGVASASTTSTVEDQVNAINANLSQAGKDAIKAIYADLKALSKSQHVTNLQPLIGNMPPAIVGTDAQQQAFVDLFVNSGAALLFPPDVDALKALKSNSDVAALIESLQGSNGLNMNITIDGMVSFSMDVFAEVNSVLGSYQPSDILDATKRTAAVKQVFNTELAKDTEGSRIYKKILQDYFSNDSDALINALSQVYHNYDASIDNVQLGTALIALADAYKKANYSAPIGGGTPATNNPTNVNDLKNYLSSIKGKLATATAEEKKALIAEIVGKAHQVAANLAKVDLSKGATISGDKASFKLDASSIASLIQGLKDIKTSLADTVGSTDGFAIPPLTLDLGTTTQSEVSADVAADILSQLKDAGVPGVAIKANGMKATLPLNDNFSKGFVFGTKNSTPTEEQTKGKKAFSKAYSFSLSVDGKAQESFNTLIPISYDVTLPEGSDSELLSVARINDDGTLTIEGGTVNVDGTNVTVTENRPHLSTYVVVENKVDFNDIAGVQAWAGRQIEVVAAKGAIQGKATGVFAPTDDITRAEFAKILVTALDLDNENAMSSKFTDVNSSDWFAPYVAVAAENGIINGRTATSFDPKATITRAEISTMIARALMKVKGVSDVADADKALAGFSDAASINSTLKGGVALAASENIVIGDNGKFRPNDKASRAEAAVMIYRTLNTKSE